MRPITDYPMDEADKQALCEYSNARDRGDTAAAQAAMRRFKASPPTLKWIKKLFGSDYVRQHHNTTLADREFGPGWLDRDG